MTIAAIDTPVLMMKDSGETMESPTSVDFQDSEKETTWTATWNATVADGQTKNKSNSAKAVVEMVDPVAGMSDDEIEAMIRKKFESAEAAWNKAKGPEIASPPVQKVNPLVQFVLDAQESERQIKAAVAKESEAASKACKFAACPIRNASQYELLQLELGENDDNLL